MAGLTENGYEAKRFRDLVEDVQLSLQESNSNIIVTDSSNKVVNNIVMPILLAIAESYELGEEVWNSFDIDTATGIALDRLGEFKDTQRRGDEFSTGFIEFTQNGIGTVNENVIVKDTTGQNLYSLEERTLTSALVNSFTIDYSSSTVIPNVTYFLTTGSDTFSYTTSLTDTLEDVYNSLQAQIDVTGRYTTEHDTLADTFFVKGVANINFSFAKRNDVVVSEFSTLVNFRASEVGDIIVNAFTATTLLSSVSNNLSVTNPRNFDRGSLQEDDEAFRERLKNTSSVNGKAVPEAIIKAISEVSGVNSVTLAINNSIFPATNGQAPKSYEAIVIGGNDQDIADAILDSGGAGIESFGNISLLSVGSSGGTYPISFTRPDNVYIFLNVEFERYEEFTQFPLNGEDLMRSALVEASSNYQADQDVIPSTLNNVIYNSVDGVGELRITAGYSYNVNDLVPVGGYSENRVAISARELAILTPERVTITETVIN